jgi:3-hydroxy acid dehydrogenase / malonic semialdehyde reductase
MSSSSSQNWAAAQVALVTGATSGFGLAFAERFLAAGGRVIATGRRIDRLQDLERRAPQGRCLARAMDVRSPASIAEALADLPSAFQAIDVLLNNAGLALGLGKAQEADLADWDAMIATNVSGLVHVTRAVLPGMVARNRGHVINMGSVAGTYPYPGGNVYGATKAFVHQFSLNLRADLLGAAVKVTSVEPGMAQTEFSAVRFKDDTAAAAQVYAGMQALSAQDVVDVIEAVLRLPPHVNINAVEVMPVQQAFGPFAVSRST